MRSDATDEITGPDKFTLVLFWFFLLLFGSILFSDWLMAIVRS